ncbi:hypothetical protein J2X07_001821 [Fictibacillus barbaricus]|uniref:Uncharacterized protein n=1 Tax=Fictibacillus barbaricus TaxID=182136 RepID=A0ABU1U051_9BACL|nr:hypothetical protein [Fictibacillus barbaricus]
MRNRGSFLDDEEEGKLGHIALDHAAYMNDIDLTVREK